MYDAISQVTELEDKVYIELRVQLAVFSNEQLYSDESHILTCLPLCLQKVGDFVTAMEKTSYNIKTELPGLLDHSRKVLGWYKYPRLPACVIFALNYTCGDIEYNCTNVCCFYSQIHCWLCRQL